MLHRRVRRAARASALVLAACALQAAAAAAQQPIDQEYTAQIRQFTTEPFFLTPLVETQIADRASETGLDRETVIRDIILEKQPSKQFATVGEIAAATAFLASKDAAQITGTTLSIDGGWTAQ